MSQGFVKDSGIALPLSVAQGGTGGTSSTGSGAVVLATSPTITTPNTVGVINASNATAGSIGEFTSSTVLSGAAVSLTTSTDKTVTSISLTAGDWDVEGNVWFGMAATTLSSAMAGAISLVTNTRPTAPGDGASTVVQGISTNGTTQLVHGIPTGKLRVSVSSTTTVYLIAFLTFTVSTATAYGFIGARRVR